ncbi:unnamed protein product [Notodromas monacha]|uniref:G-protein coupled receptors family 1 profile domain-containing protein n=1 Tax=Notodromas monacha TaxID=399045 RepID=A0A7R9BC78_9CRUS|nr:unnamed protein product [Notodromas monacha]CAG0912549.1 unnamed protein product [Notodromas monacha]
MGDDYETAPTVGLVDDAEYCNATNRTGDGDACGAFAGHLINGYLMPLLVVITVVANTLVIIVLSKRHMRTPTNMVLLAMAVADMLKLIFPAPWFFYKYTLDNAYKPLQPVAACYVAEVMQNVFPVLFHTASIWLTVALAAQRYIYVCHPTAARTWCTMPKVRMAVIGIFVCAFLHQSTRFVDFKKAEVNRQRLIKDNKPESRKMRDSQSTTFMLNIVVTVFLVVEIPLGVVTTLHIIVNMLSVPIMDYNVANCLILCMNCTIAASHPIYFAIYCGMSRQFRQTFSELFIAGFSGSSAGNGASARNYSVANGG